MAVHEINTFRACISVLSAGRERFALFVTYGFTYGHISAGAGVPIFLPMS